MKNKTTYTGQCLCGLIKYQVTEIESQTCHCHCKMCRKFHGAAFATFAEAKVDNFNWLTGEEHLKTYLAENGTRRKFCNQCGSSLIFVPSNDKGKLIEFTLATLDSKIDLKPDAHIFTDSKACWYDITDDLPQFTEGRGSKKRI